MFQVLSLSLSLSPFIPFCEQRSFMPCTVVDQDHCKAVQSLGSFVAVFLFWICIYSKREAPKMSADVSPYLESQGCHLIPFLSLLFLSLVLLLFLSSPVLSHSAYFPKYSPVSSVRDQAVFAWFLLSW